MSLKPLIWLPSLIRCACAAIFFIALPALAQKSAYRYTLPPGWTSSPDASADTLVPSSEPAGSVQALLIAPKPLEPNFDAQFEAERKALEAHWGLNAPQPVAPQRGRSSEGPYAAYFASYASEGGPRYMSFLAVGRQGKFSLLVFVSATDDAFNRLAPAITQMWQGLQVNP